MVMNVYYGDVKITLSAILLKFPFLLLVNYANCVKLMSRLLFYLAVAACCLANIGRVNCCDGQNFENSVSYIVAVSWIGIMAIPTMKLSSSVVKQGIGEAKTLPALSYNVFSSKPFLIPPEKVSGC